MDDRIETLLAELTLEEKASLTAGVDLWHTPAIARLHIPALKLSDGPIGARGAAMWGGPTAACFPCGTALAATWNTALVERVGAALGDEARSKGAHVLLAPTVNLQRTPLAGRNFEGYSEDPELTARIAVAYIRGVQSRRVAACVKHFVCNDSEYERMTISSEVDERTLRELYLVPFEAAVREAGVWALMSSYNRVNGTYASEHHELLGKLLRDEWGFDGLIVSDWFGTHSTRAAGAGLDLEMPGPARHLGAKALEAVQKGELDEATLDRAVRRLLRAALRTGALEEPASRPEQARDLPEHRALAREVAREAIVLLRNERSVLPLDPTRLRSLALIGPNALVARIQGGGSARVPPHYAISPLEGIRKRCGDGVKCLHEPGCSNHRAIPPLELPELTLEYWKGSEPQGDPVLSKTVSRADFTWFGSFAPELDPTRYCARLRATLEALEGGTHTLSLTSAGRSRLYLDDRLLLDSADAKERGPAFVGLGSQELRAEVALQAGERRDLRVEYAREGALLGGLRVGYLPAQPADLLERALAAAAGADAAIVVVGTTDEWESEGFDRGDLELPGAQAELIERVAAVNPNTIVVVNAGAPVRMDWIERVPAALQLWYPGQEGGNALADVLFGDASPSGRLPHTVPARLEDNPAHPYYPGANGRVVYGEGIFIGYRHYEKRGIAPRFPFGHGLAYTSFAYGPLRVDGAGLPVQVTLDVTNTGARAGQEVVQLYVRDPAASVPRPEKELRAFTKVALLPGESRAVRFALDRRAFAFWDPRRGDWQLEPGEFELLVGSSSADIRARATIALDGG